MNLKNLSALFVSAFLFILTSCKKDYTCTCTDSTGATSVTTIPDAKKDDAKKACDALNTIQILIGGSCTLSD